MNGVPHTIHWVDTGIILSYFVLLIFLGMRQKRKSQSVSNPTDELLLGGRELTLPAFVASLVSTWYGGITGISEYTWAHGIETFFVFGIPYYLAAFLFAIILAEPIRRSGALSLPDHLSKVYSPMVGKVAACVIFLMVLPAGYVLILATLANYLFGWPFWLAAPVATFISVSYLFLGGFRSVVRTDIAQTILMYLGFIVLFIYLVVNFGGLNFILTSIPRELVSIPSSGSAWLGIAAWCIVALSTLIDPAFFQRCLASEGKRVPRKGILLSIVCWVVFDFLSISCALYARALLSSDVGGTLAYPALALQMLPVGMAGIFLLAVIATAQSSVDSYLFIAATTLAGDFIPAPPKSEAILSRRLILGLIASVAFSLLIAAIFPSVIQIWYFFGTLAAGMLLLPVLASFHGPQLSSRWAMWAISLGALVVLIWEGWQRLDPSNSTPFGLPTAIPAVVVTGLAYGAGRLIRQRKKAVSSPPAR